MLKHMTFYDWMEGVNIKNLHQLNKEKKWFSKIEPTKRMSHTDAVCHTKEGRKITVELKTRDEKIEQFNKWGDVLIEPSKISEFTRIMESGYSLNENCLYINFTPDGAIMFSFNDLKGNVNFYPNHRHYNKGKEQWENETRIGLPMSDAIVIKWS